MLSAQSECGRIDSILLRHPADAWASQESVDSQWRELGYRARPDFREACREYDALVRILEPRVSDIQWLQGDSTTLDSIYVRDAGVVCDRGIALCRMGKALRRGEPDAIDQWLAENRLSTLGRISGDGLLEGGDLVWLDSNTIAVGQGYRSNQSGLRQLLALFGEGIEAIPVPLPHWNGPGDVLHLMSMISPLANDLALVYSKLMPVFFREYLLARSITLLEVPDDEYPGLASNVLALAPRLCLLVQGNPKTRALLESAGCEVIEFSGQEICIKGEGGPTCLTRPLQRDV